MNLIPDKTSPQPVPQKWEASPPTSHPNANLDPILLDLIGNVKEKNVSKSNPMRLSD
jgi:hypothetical protein